MAPCSSTPNAADVWATTSVGRRRNETGTLFKPVFNLHGAQEWEISAENAPFLHRVRPAQNRAGVGSAECRSPTSSCGFPVGRGDCYAPRRHCLGSGFPSGHHADHFPYSGPWFARTNDRYGFRSRLPGERPRTDYLRRYPPRHHRHRWRIVGQGFHCARVA